MCGFDPLYIPYGWVAWGFVLPTMVVGGVSGLHWLHLVHFSPTGLPSPSVI